MIVDKPGRPEADRSWTSPTSRRGATEHRPYPGDTPMREEPGDELPIGFVSRRR